ncbi:PIG-L deacetylase family protein [Mobilicoccus massiliensis]|uniref:PIG-L deacetylase family protein n=1 Tax=Mobilicoccus massiliensis TaxID=1522310 RepID=UPI00058F6506|nr:PIG-L deacetylase family protein [Mobilicoccus massiliensis]
MSTLPTLPDDWNTALVVVAHPDDIEYGLAAAVDRWTSDGRTVTYLLATHGEAGIDTMDPAEAAVVRAQEERDGAVEVGVDVVEFLDHSDGVLEYGLDLRRDIARVIRARRPEALFCLTHRERFAGGGTNQADHRVVGQAAMDAARDAGNRWVHPELNTDDEPWGGTKFIAYANAPQPTHALDVTGHFDAAVASLEAHRQYLDALGEDYPSPRELLTGILTGGGALTGTQHGVGFEVFDL